MIERRRLTWRRVLRDGVVLYLTVVALRLFVVDVYLVPSGSMRPTLVQGDYVVANRLAYGVSLASLAAKARRVAAGWQWRMPERGDVIVFRHPREPDLVMVKRVVGLPGDRVAAAVPGYLGLNGTSIQRLQVDRESGQWRECITSESCHLVVDQPSPGGRGPETNLGVTPVAAGHLYVLGDHRLSSLDSRLGWQVPIGNVLGRIERIAWSGDPAVDSGPLARLGTLRWRRIGLAVQ